MTCERCGMSMVVRDECIACGHVQGHEAREPTEEDEMMRTHNKRKPFAGRGPGW